MKKIKLSDIKVKSFITAVSSQSLYGVKGGTSEDTTESVITIVASEHHIECSLFCYGTYIEDKFR